MPGNQYLIVSGLCLLFAITGGVGGYNLKSRMQDPDKPELTTGLSALHTSLNANHSNNTASNCESYIAKNATQSLSQPTAAQANNHNTKRIKQLLKTIHSIAGTQGIEFNLDAQVKTELEFLNIVDQSPGLINPLLTVYQQMPQSETRDLLQSLLITTGSSQIQARAIEYLTSGQIKFQSDWLALLRDSGVNSSQARDALFNIIPSLIQPQAIHDAILSITPQIVSANERLTIINHLTTYANHTNEIVRTAAIESISKWADQGHAPIIEQALNDTSENVRYAAIAAAYSSGIRSDYIESTLLDVMNNPGEDLQLRIHAYNALSNYSLQGQNYDQYYQFHQRLLSIENAGEAKG